MTFNTAVVSAFTLVVAKAAAIAVHYSSIKEVL
ncbi:hypothetical protein LTSEMIN_6425, partial [Salmonella enterica subsp. enterica serovar Minnesota str. A4-603]